MVRPRIARCFNTTDTSHAETRIRAVDCKAYSVFAETDLGPIRGPIGGPMHRDSFNPKTPNSTAVHVKHTNRRGYTRRPHEAAIQLARKEDLSA